MSEEFRKMAFTEIGLGSLGVDVQQAFEKAQMISAERGVNTKVKLNIEVYPPSDDAQYGGVVYSVDVAQPAKKSRRHETILENGISVRNAEIPLEQLSMMGPEKPESVVDFKKAQGNDS